MESPTVEGYAPVPGGQVWYKIVGSGDALPLLTLHGGPSVGHDYLETLEGLASDRPVVFFDQLGCGRSDKPENVSLWRIERFVEEVAAVRKALDLKRLHLYGHSWGGWLAIEYMLGKPTGVASLTLGSTSASSRQFVDELKPLRAALPQDVRETLERYEALGDYHSPEYQKAVSAFQDPLFCRVRPVPEPLIRSGKILRESRAPYETIWGPNEFTATGNLQDWERRDRLQEINVPTLVVCGWYDLCRPACSESLHRGIPNSEMHIFEDCAHMAHLEEPESYVQVMREFLDRVERELVGRPANMM
ncbi:MAG: proline iminopeptidase-family hydrolase [Nitrososphaerales archaeon]